MLHAARMAAAGDIDAARRYLRLARLAKTQGLEEQSQYRLDQALASRKSWHHNIRPIWRHMYGATRRSRFKPALPADDRGRGSFVGREGES
jgi:rubrerythrin